MSAAVRSADIIRKYYAAHPQAWQILLEHSRQVTKRALKIARQLQKTEQVDLQFIAEAAMLHDVGMIATEAPELGCHGQDPYLCHGIRGREMLEKEGLPDHALVCERHIGTGLTAREIISENLPLPPRDMLPISLEEQIICYVDLFYSKSLRKNDGEKSVGEVRKTIKRYGSAKLKTFDQWLQRFEPELVPCKP